MKPTKPMKDETRVLIAAQFGYSVWVFATGDDSLDSSLPVFHRFDGATAKTKCGREVPMPAAIAMPSVHAVRFAVPCDECFPEKL